MIGLSHCRLKHPSLEDANNYGRVQRRLTHLLSQAAERSTTEVTTDVLPPISADHEFHPATKILSFRYFVLGAARVPVCNFTTAASLFRPGMGEDWSKPKAEMAVARFLSRGGGFLSKQGDASLKDVGLDALCPTHYNRTGQRSAYFLN